MALEILHCRFKGNKKGFLSRVSIDNEHICFLLENPWYDNAPNISCIPAGIRYKCRKYYHERRGWVLRILNVPERTEIMVHPGNTLKDTLGCPLPGLEYHTNRKYEVWHSKDAMDLLLEKIGQEEVLWWRIVDLTKKTYMVLDEEEPFGDIRIKTPIPKLIPEEEEIPIHDVKEYVKVPFWKQDGFTRGLSAAATIVGIILYFVDPIVGKAAIAVSGTVGGYGLLKASKKSKPTTNQNRGLWDFIIELLKFLFNRYINKNK